MSSTKLAVTIRFRIASCSGPWNFDCFRRFFSISPIVTNICYDIYCRNTESPSQIRSLYGESNRSFRYPLPWCGKIDDQCKRAEPAGVEAAREGEGFGVESRGLRGELDLPPTRGRTPQLRYHL